MTEEQIQHINTQLRFLGFAGYAAEELDKYSGYDSYELTQSKQFGEETVNASLVFATAVKSGNIYFKAHTLSLRDRTHCFHLYHGKGITLKEGFNMLSGRAVRKKVVDQHQLDYYAWLRFDFSLREATGYHVEEFSDNHGFDLNIELDHIGLRPYGKWDRLMILRSLQKGNLLQVMLESGKAWIAADPAQRIITVIPGDGLPGSIKERADVPLSKASQDL